MPRPIPARRMISTIPARSGNRCRGMSRRRRMRWGGRRAWWRGLGSRVRDTRATRFEDLARLGVQLRISFHQVLQSVRKRKSGRIMQTLLYTLGYEGLSIEAFISRLKATGVHTVIDVRA